MVTNSYKMVTILGVTKWLQFGYKSVTKSCKVVTGEKPAASPVRGRTMHNYALALYNYA